MKLGINKQTVKLALNWCVEKLGESNYNESPPKLFCYNRVGQDARGYYKDDTNTLVIYLLSHTSVLDLIRTVVHEYIHFLQDPEEYEKYIDVFVGRGGNFDNHPHEQEALLLESKYAPICKKEITAKLRQ
jgi:hypothetical protein